MDPATSDIRAVEFTPSRDGDSPVLPDLLSQFPAGEPTGTVTADGACETRLCHTAIIERDAVAIPGPSWPGGYGGTTARPPEDRTFRRFTGG